MFKHDPNYFTLEELLKSVNSAQAGINGKWVPARPVGFHSLWWNLKLAWLVFKGEADCLVWPEGQ